MDVLYAPSYPQNIFSVRAAAEKGASVMLNANDGVLIHNDGVRFPIHTFGRLYYLNLCKDAVHSCQPSPPIRSSTLKEWHKILGHTNKADVLKLEAVVDDMKITSKDDFECPT